MKRGDKVRKRNELHIGTIVAIKERGVAGCGVTYIEWIEVAYPNGMIVRGDPSSFEEAENK